MVESTLAHHLLQCVVVETEGELPFADAREKFGLSIRNSRRQSALKRWIAGLLRQPA